MLKGLFSCFSYTVLFKYLIKTMESISEIRSFNCNVCGKGFYYKSRLNRHLVTHTGETRFKCDVCGKEFFEKVKLKRHLVSHTGEGNVKCDICGKGFFCRYYLDKHMATHTGEKDFQCSICGRAFSQKYNLERHIVTHTKPAESQASDENFSCGICGRDFSKKSALCGHMATHVMEKNFICSVCGKGYSRKPHLHRHMRSHAGDGAFKCKICEKGFSWELELMKHMRTHTVEKNFKCDVCGKGFAGKRSLNGHMPVHTGNWDFNCSICGKGFSQDSYLRRHLKTHEGQKNIEAYVSPSDQRRVTQERLLDREGNNQITGKLELDEENGSDPLEDGVCETKSQSSAGDYVECVLSESVQMSGEMLGLGPELSNAENTQSGAINTFYAGCDIIDTKTVFIKEELSHVIKGSVDEESRRIKREDDCFSSVGVSTNREIIDEINGGVVASSWGTIPKLECLLSESVKKSGEMLGLGPELSNAENTQSGAINTSYAGCDIIDTKTVCIKEELDFEVNVNHVNIGSVDEESRKIKREDGCFSSVGVSTNREIIDEINGDVVASYWGTVPKLEKNEFIDDERIASTL